MSKHFNYAEEPKQSTPLPVANYRKVDEQVVSSYDRAQEVADAVFAPYGTKDANGSRTTAEAKVRVRLNRGSDGSPDSFRVILYKHLSTFKTKEKPKQEDAPTKSKKQARQRNDRKGKNRKVRENKTTSA